MSALSDNAKWIKGEVEKISIENGIPKLHIGGDTVALENVSEILSPQESSPEEQ